jgi:hypothetical protein
MTDRYTPLTRLIASFTWLAVVGAALIPIGIAIGLLADGLSPTVRLTIVLSCIGIGAIHVAIGLILRIRGQRLLAEAKARAD